MQLYCSVVFSDKDKPTPTDSQEDFIVVCRLKQSKGGLWGEVGSQMAYAGLLPIPGGHLYSAFRLDSSFTGDITST